VNGDGWLDAVFGSYVQDVDTSSTFGGSVAFLGEGFAPDDQVYLSASGVRGVEAADLDGDGGVELVLANAWDGTTTALDSPVYAYDGQTWSAVAELPTTGAAAVLSADLDADGFVDLVFANGTDGATTAVDSTIYWGRAGGYSASDTTPLPTQGASELAIADLDGDGLLDIAFANTQLDGDYEVDSWVYFGGDSYVTASRLALPTVGARDVVAADLDADGYVDLVFANAYDGSSTDLPAYVYWGSADGPSATDRTEIAVEGAAGVDAADLNLDGTIDLVFARAWDPVDGYDTESLVYLSDGTRDLDGIEPLRLPTAGAGSVTACPGGKRCGD
jgi:hypothetical protein